MKPTRRAVIAAAASLSGLPEAAAAAGWPLPPEGGVKEIEHTWIPMADGVRLSARLFLPEGRGPCPAVLEYIPYRKRDTYRQHDTAWGHQMASRGFAYVRVDVRGSGDSEGVLTDEYSETELADGEAILDWMSRQPWCTGAVGMRGLSWGGINTLQIAARRPKALKAIMALGTTDTRYGNDAHYVGGAVGHTNLQWGVLFKTVMAGPPDPAIVGDAWEGMWRDRLAATPAIMKTWLEHQTNDAYWRRGSIDQDWSAIQVPTYVVSGWRDAYADPVPRLLEHLTVPRKGMIGPWGHIYPWAATPHGLDWAVEELRWWTKWLVGAETGIMDEPMLRVFMPYASGEATAPKPVPGRWIAEPTWPSRSIQRKPLHLTSEGLAEAAGPPAQATVEGGKVIGLTKPEWIDRPPMDQSLDDARALTFDSAPLDADLEVLGTPVLRVRVRSDQPVATLAVRLTEVTPEGRSWLVTWGVKNLTHRTSDAAPVPLTPGTFYDVAVPLIVAGRRFNKGSRIRVSLSEGLWPLVWPSPQTATLDLALDHCSLELPVRPLETTPAAFAIPERISEGPAPGTITTAPVSPGHYRITLDSPPVPYTWPDIGSTTSRGHSETVELTEGEPNSGVWVQKTVSAWSRGDWACEVTATVELRSTATDFLVSESLSAARSGAVVFERASTVRIPRRLV